MECFSSPEKLVEKNCARPPIAKLTSLVSNERQRARETDFKFHMWAAEREEVLANCEGQRELIAGERERGFENLALKTGALSSVHTKNHLWRTIARLEVLLHCNGYRRARPPPVASHWTGEEKQFCYTNWTGGEKDFTGRATLMTAEILRQIRLEVRTQNNTRYPLYIWRSGWCV